LVEIWQCDASGVYLHSGSDGAEKRDKNFQGFGRFLTGANGEYLFRTIKPVPYTGRTPHIHYKVKARGEDMLTTQLYIKGHPQNENDGIWRSVRDEKAREAITVDFDAAAGRTGQGSWLHVSIWCSESRPKLSALSAVNDG
jgi:protocatechuate 3,4-dioxygenase beta subunit